MQIYTDERAIGYGVDILVGLEEITTPTAGEVINKEYWAVDKKNGLLHIYYFDGEVYPQCNESLTTANHNCVAAYGLAAKTVQVDEVFIGEDLKNRIEAFISQYDASKVVALTPGTL